MNRMLTGQSDGNPGNLRIMDVTKSYSAASGGLHTAAFARQQFSWSRSFDILAAVYQQTVIQAA